MTPEERIAEYFIWVLDNIIEESLVTLEGEAIEYEFSRIAGSGIPSKDTEEKILLKLLELKAISIPDRIDPSSDYQGMFYLKIIEPKFTEIYNKYKKLTSRGSKLANSFSVSNLRFVLQVLEGVASAAEFSTGNEISYKLQFPPGQLIMQERQLLTKLQSLGYLRYTGEDGIYGVTSLRSVDVPSINDAIAIIKERLNPDQSNNASINIEPTDTKAFSESTDWTSQSKWISKLEYALPNGKKVLFGAQVSARKTIFEMLLKEKGYWVKVQDMAKEINKDDKTVRTTIGQMNEENLKDTGLTIIPRKDVGEPGAYKLVYQEL